MVKYDDCGRAYVGVSNKGPELTTNIVLGDVFVGRIQGGSWRDSTELRRRTLNKIEIVMSKIVGMYIYHHFQCRK